MRLLPRLPQTRSFAMNRCDPPAVGSDLRARRQGRLAHEVRVHPARRLPPLPDRPHHARLSAPRVSAREHPRHRRLVVGPRLQVAARGQLGAELGDDRVGLGAEEAEREEHEVAVERELAPRHLLHDGAAVVVRYSRPTPHRSPTSRSSTVALAPGTWIICYDVLDPRLALGAARRGAELIVTLSNGSWFAEGRGRAC